VPRNLPLLLLALAAAPSVAAAFGWWSPWGAESQQFALRALLASTLLLEDGVFGRGVLGTWEIPAALAALAAAALSASAWEARLPTWARLHVVPEALLALVGLGAAAAGMAVGVAVDRPFTLGLVAVFAATCLAAPPRAPLPWGDRANRGWRVAIAVGAAAAGIYGAASLLEGATFKNPAFRLTEAWVGGPGRTPWLSGGLWLAGGALGALPRARALRSASVWVGAAVLCASGLSAAGAPTARLAIGSGLSGLGVALLVAAWLPTVQTGLPRSWAQLDPRALARLLAPAIAIAGLAGLRGFTILLGTAPGALPPGVEQLSDVGCVFGLQVDSARDRVWYTDRCRVRLGRIDSAGERTWDLREVGAHQVEELAPPDADGNLWTAVVAWTEEAQLVLLSVDGDDGPARAEGPSGSGADRPYIPLPSCWASAWVPTGDGRVLLGCENTTRSPVLDPAARDVVGDVELGTRLEDGRVRDGRLFGVALWDDPRVRAWSWPGGEVLAERRIGPFNWGVERSASPDALWVSRFVEGALLQLDPATLEVQGQTRLSFGLRALLHEPVAGELWAAAAYSGRLWRVDPTDPSRRQALALCGQARALASDEAGRIYVATDCGIFRIDPASLPPL